MSKKPLFAVPAALGDFEEEPYNLLPYPGDFDEDGDEACRAAAFSALVSVLVLFGAELRLYACKVIKHVLNGCASR